MDPRLAGAAWVLPLALTLLGVSAGLVVARLLRGPTGPDRVVAIDALTLLGISAVALGVLFTGEAGFLDVAVVLALVGFLGTVAFAPLFRAGDHRPGDGEGGAR